MLNLPYYIHVINDRRMVINGIKIQNEIHQAKKDSSKRDNFVANFEIYSQHFFGNISAHIFYYTLSLIAADIVRQNLNVFAVALKRFLKVAVLLII